jgi:hypothetical protein
MTNAAPMVLGAAFSSVQFSSTRQRSAILIRSADGPNGHASNDDASPSRDANRPA